MDVLFDDAMLNKRNSFLLFFFSVIAVFCISNLSGINTLTYLSPIDRTYFNWSDTDCGKELSWEKETRSYYFFFCNCSFLHQQPIRNKYFDLPFPNRQDLFQLIRHWLWKRAELSCLLRSKNPFQRYFMVSHFTRADLSCVLKILVAPSTPVIILLFCSWTWSNAIREKGRFVLAKLKTSLSICW